MKTIDFYKRVLERAKRARISIEETEATYQRACEMEKGLLDDGMVGKEGYEAHIAGFKNRRDEEIEESLSMIDAVKNEYNGIMDDMARPDGSRIDEDAMRLLDSGLALTEKEWQRLADDFRDNSTMTRILRQRYDESRSKDSGNIQGIFQSGQGVQGEDVPRVTFGQSPESRKEIFNSFADLIRHTCVSGTVLREYADRESYWNSIAKNSIGKMQPFADEDFESVNEDFPVTYQARKFDLW